MMPSYAVILIFCLYIGLLWCLAMWTERFTSLGSSLVDSPLVYSLSLAVYCSSWTLYGSVGMAANRGLLFLTIYLGPTLMVVFWNPLLRRMVHLKNNYRITSIADFISSRYEKSERLAASVTVVALVGSLPYLGLQFKSILSTFSLITKGTHEPTGWVGAHVGGIVVGLMILFTIMFGVRRLDPTERHDGMVMAVAAESIVKLAALMAVGLWVVFGLFGGPGGLFERLAAAPAINDAACGNMERIGPATWLTYLMLSANAVICLPRQFHVSVVENHSPGHIRWAVWLFPLYMFLISMFIYPIALGGVLQGYPVGEADTFVLRFPLDQNHWPLTALVFIGGFSAATSMIMISAMTMATMISNHLLLPLADVVPRLSFLNQRLLQARWLTVAGFIGLGYGFERLIGVHLQLAEMGLVSFGAALQFAPALLGGLIWREGNLRGALSGLWAGFAIWAYTMGAPILVQSGFLPSSILTAGPGGWALLRPQALLGLDALDPVAHSALWSLGVNTGLYVLGSLWKEPSPSGLGQAEAFVGPDWNDSVFHGVVRTPGRPVSRIEDKKEIIFNLYARFFPEDKAAALCDAALDNAQLKHRKTAAINELAELYDQVERTLAGSIGAAMANRALTRAEFFNPREADELKILYAQILAGLRTSPQDLKRKIDYYIEREALINRHAEELAGKIEQLEKEMAQRRAMEDKLRESEERYRLAIEGSSDGVIVNGGGLILWGNSQLPVMFGYEALDELIGRSLGCLVHPDDRERVLDISRRRQSGQPAEPRYDYKGVKKDGSAIYVAVSATTINYHNRILSLAYLRDVTSRRMAEEEIHFLSRRLIESIEEERRRLAADLHDEFGQSLTALHLGVESIRRTLEKDRPELARTCDKMVSSIENLAENIRGVAGRLRPDMLDHLGLVASMEWYVDEYRQGLPDSVVSFRAVGFVGRRRLDPQFEIVLYRVFQEALTNAAKHARAGRVDVRLTYSHPNVILVITDDGRGFDQGEIMGPGMRPRRGIGLISMKERVAAAGGTIDVRSAPGRGTAIRVTLDASAPPRTPASGRTP